MYLRELVLILIYCGRNMQVLLWKWETRLNSHEDDRTPVTLLKHRWDLWQKRNRERQLFLQPASGRVGQDHWIIETA
ncbi:hypothetical protein OUZ56_022953 [Daphnia magna]|uniref:Uncharacterized protein n=1 Tax=Daphnia magna TaxID=35525 RepID=A0ABR0AXY3_9CRUS|nr:hypothetical protein OUZ56_022953 [Daphnia magna]